MSYISSLLQTTRSRLSQQLVNRLPKHIAARIMMPSDPAPIVPVTSASAVAVAASVPVETSSVFSTAAAVSAHVIAPVVAPVPPAESIDVDVSKVDVGDDEGDVDRPDTELRRLRRVETVLRDRIGRVALVLERTNNSHNFAAVLRTAEALGFQHIWIVAIMPEVQELNTRRKRPSNRQIWKEDDEAHEVNIGIGKGATKWLTTHVFNSAKEAITDLKSKGYDIWTTDLSQRATALSFRVGDAGTPVLPSKLAFVMGTEACGVSQLFVDAADRRVFLPMFGFADSFNLSVSCAMMMQHLCFHYPDIIGSLDDVEKCELREKWYLEMARSPEEKDLFLGQLDSPPKPFRDTRRADEHRVPRLRPGDIKNMVSSSEYQPGR